MAEMIRCSGALKEFVEARLRGLTVDSSLMGRAKAEFEAQLSGGRLVKKNLGGSRGLGRTTSAAKAIEPADLTPSPAPHRDSVAASWDAAPELW